MSGESGSEGTGVLTFFLIVSQRGAYSEGDHGDGEGESEVW